MVRAMRVGVRVPWLGLGLDVKDAAVELLDRVPAGRYKGDTGETQGRYRGDTGGDILRACIACHRVASGSSQLSTPLVKVRVRVRVSARACVRVGCRLTLTRTPTPTLTPALTPTLTPALTPALT